MQLLPPEVLSRIGGFIGPGSQIKLWNTGDRSLRGRLRCDLFRSFELKYTAILDFVCPVTKFPSSVVSKWTDLYRLKIDLSDRTEIPLRASILQSLPRTLRKLAFYFRERLTDDLLQYLPQELTELELPYNREITDKGVSLLPQCLQLLNLARVYHFTDEAIKNLPRGLKHFVQYNSTKFTDDCIPLLPRGLTYLDLTGASLSNKELSRLPHSLTYLELWNCVNITDEGLSSLPPSLIYLSLHRNDRISDMGLDNLPKNLQYLYVQL